MKVFCSFKYFIYFLRERKRGGRRGRETCTEKHRSVASRMPPTKDLAHNSGMCPVVIELSLSPLSQPARQFSVGSFIYLFLFFIFRERWGMEKERERNISVWLLLVTPPRTCPTTQAWPWLGIELESLWFKDYHSIHWATPARALYSKF